MDHDTPMTGRRADSIRETLEQVIVTEAFADGDRLDETRLSERFSVSRTPLREALQMLAASGLVQLVPHRGAYVRHPGVVELVQMFEVMAELEGMCGRLAAKRLPTASKRCKAVMRTPIIMKTNASISCCMEPAATVFWGHVRQCGVGWLACGHDHAVFVEMLGMGSVSS